jgi:predicted SAM-dependent methyltransferase
MSKVNLGCGKLHKKGYINIDVKPPADVICNIGKERLPYKDGELELVEADNLMEHFDNDEFMFAMNEIFRVLRSGGVFWWKVPDAENWPDAAFGDPTHKRFFFPRSFLYMDRATQQWKHYGRHYGFEGWIKRKLETDNRFFTCELVKP